MAAVDLHRCKMEMFTPKDDIVAYTRLDLEGTVPSTSSDVCLQPKNAYAIFKSHKVRYVFRMGNTARWIKLERLCARHSDQPGGEMRGCGEQWRRDHFAARSWSRPYR